MQERKKLKNSSVQLQKPLMLQWEAYINWYVSNLE